MEQRIQQLAQSLSRIGRVLDRHRESVFAEGDNSRVDSEKLRSLVPSPVKIMPDKDVVNWIWNDENGVVRSLFALVEQHFPKKSLLYKMLSNTRDTYPVLAAFTQHIPDPFAVGILGLKGKHACTDMDARRLVQEALLQLRANIVDFLALAEEGYLESLKEKRRETERRSREKKAKKKKCVDSEGADAISQNGSSVADTDAMSIDGEDEALHIRGGGPPLDDSHSNLAGVDLLLAHAVALPEESVRNEPSVDNVSSQQREAEALTHIASQNPYVINSSAGPSQLSAASSQYVNETSHATNNVAEQEIHDKEQPSLEDFMEAPVSANVAASAADSPGPESEDAKKKKTNPMTPEQVNYLKSWLLDPRHILNPYPTDEEKNVIMRDIGCERKHLESWLGRHRKTVCNPELVPIEMKWSKTENDHWVEFRKHRYMLEATADLLLMYANTHTFFSLESFRPFDSTPIEVYARELGNDVPRRLSVNCQKNNVEVADSNDESFHRHETSCIKSTSNRSFDCKEDDEELCSPDDVVTTVTVNYKGDYVLSQLLQWFNGGIGQKSGLPDIYGCVMLPPVSGCWEEINCGEVKCPKHTRSNPITMTEYEANARPQLIEWVDDRFQRGSPWCEEVSRYFCPLGSTPNPSLPMGSPVLDYLVTGLDENIRKVSAALKGFDVEVPVEDESGRSRKKGSASDRLQSTVDEGMPAQAVANWVQCEHPKCLKWRKLPWHVDVDLLPEKFYCTDNIWNPDSATCDAPEDKWDMEDAPIKFDTVEDDFEMGGERIISLPVSCIVSLTSISHSCFLHCRLV